MSDLEKLLGELSGQYSLVAMYAFGSRSAEVAARVAGEAIEAEHLTSDVDIGVLPERGHRLTARDRVRLMIALEDALDAGREDLEPEVVERFREGDLRHCYADIRKIETVLGFEPRVSFEDGMRELAEWVRQQEAVDMVDKAYGELRAHGLTVQDRLVGP